MGKHATWHIVTAKERMLSGIPRYRMVRPAQKSILMMSSTNFRCWTCTVFNELSLIKKEAEKINNLMTYIMTGEDDYIK